MTRERAREIISQARAAATCGPWSDRLDDVMTDTERREVGMLWETMPGHTCFLDALLRIANSDHSGTLQYCSIHNRYCADADGRISGFAHND